MTSSAHGLADVGVQFVCGSVVDGGGICRVKCVPLAKLEAAVRFGVGMPRSWSMSMSNDHFARPDGLGGPSGDLRLRPDLAAIVQLAATPFWAWVPCDQYTEDGDVFALCQRSFLKRMVEDLRDAHYRLDMSYEFEWFTMRAAPWLSSGFVPVHEGPGFSAAAWACTQNFGERLLTALERQGLDVEVFHPEFAAGQFEVSCAPLDPLGAADRNVLFRHTVHAVSALCGYRSSFAPVRIAGTVGSGCHLHFSLHDEAGRNLFTGGSGPLGLTQQGESFLAGVLSEVGPLTAIGCPTVPSYERLQPGRWACAYRIWGHENREAALRMIPGMAGQRQERANAELRVIDCAAHPYLAAAAVIAAGLAGLRERLTLPEPVDGDPHLLTDAMRRERGIRLLPRSLKQATHELAASDRLRAAMGQDLLDAVVEVRRAEAAADADRPLDEVIAEHLWRF